MTWAWLRMAALGAVLISTYLLLFWPAMDPQRGAYVFFCATNAILYSHYLMNLFMSPGSLRRVLGFSGGQVLILLVALLSLAMVWAEPEISFIVFGFHFALTETYSRFLIDGEREFFLGASRSKSFFRFAHLVFLTCLYFYGTYHTFLYVTLFQPIVAAISFVAVGWAFALSALAYFSILLFLRRELFSNGATFFSYLGPELLLCLFAMIAHEYRLVWTVFVLYHIFFWLMAPLYFAKRSSIGALVKTYWAPTFAIMALGALFFPAFMQGHYGQAYARTYASVDLPYAGFDPQVMTDPFTHAQRQAMGWGLVHTMFSLVLSTLNPTWLRRLTTADGSDPLK